MKSKTNPLNNLDLDQLRDVVRFCTFLYRLNLKETDDIENAVHDEITDNYCSDCEMDLQSCDCRHYNEYEPDEDAIYDRWKDQQLMDED